MIKFTLGIITLVFIFLFATGQGLSDVANSKVAKETVELIHTGTLAAKNVATTATTQAEINAAFAE